MFLRCLTNLLRHVSQPDDPSVTPRKPHICLQDWCCFALVIIPSRIWRQHNRFLNAYLEVCMRKQYMGVDISSCGVGCSAGLPAAFLQRLPAAQRMVHVACAGQCFFAKFAESYWAHVLHSHGDHIPAEIRMSATFAWWLPELLVVDYKMLQQDSAQWQKFWSPRLDALGTLVDHVRRVVTCYEWHGPWELGKQYKCLIMHWRDVLAGNDRVRTRTWRASWEGGGV